MKYIDADKLIAEIDKRYAEYRAKMKTETDDYTYYQGMADALDLFEQFIDSLQQEQPVVKDPFDDEQFRRGYEAGKHDAMREQKPKIELIQRAWYMEGYHDCEFGYEPKWIIKTGEGGPQYKLNPNREGGRG